MSENILLSDDPARLQFDRIHDWLASSYWSPGIERELVEKAAAGSHCLGAYRGVEQIGYARIISDRATFGWIADVWIEESERGQGLGKHMVRWFVEHPDYADIRRIGLVTRDAHGVYEALGFHKLIRPDNYMERLSADFAASLRDAT